VANARELNVPYMKLASYEWTNLTEDDKREWQEQTELDSWRYHKEWNEYWRKKHPPRG
jgi:hypothetical protein